MSNSTLSQLHKKLQVMGATVTLDGTTMGPKWGAYLEAFWGGRGFVLMETRISKPDNDRIPISGKYTLPGAKQACPVEGWLEADAQERIDVTLRFILGLGIVNPVDLLGIYHNDLLKQVLADGAVLTLSCKGLDPAGDGSGFSPRPVPAAISDPGVAAAPAGIPLLEISVNPDRISGDSPVKALLGKTPVRFSGPFFYDNTTPCFFLTADRRVKLPFGEQSPEMTPHLFTHGADGAAPFASLGASVSIALEKKALALLGRVEHASHPAVFYLLQSGLTLNGFEALASLLHQPAIREQLPPAIQKLAQVSLNKFRIAVIPDLRQIAWVEFSLGLGDVTLIPGTSVAQLTEVALNVSVQHPFDPGGPGFAATATATMTGLGVSLQMTGSAPGFIFTGNLKEGDVIPVSKVLGQLFKPLGLPWPDAIPQVDLTAAHLELNGKTGDLSLDLGAEITNTYAIGELELRIQDLSLHFSREEGQFHLALGLQASFLNILVALLAEYESDGTGWLFSGKFTLPKPVSLPFLTEQILRNRIEINRKYFDFEVEYGSLVFGLKGPYFYAEFGVKSHFDFGDVGKLRTEYALFEFTAPAKNRPAEWRFGLKGGLQFPFQIPELRGFLQFTKDKSGMSLEFIGDGELPFELPKELGKAGMVLEEPRLALTRDNEGAWTCSSSTQAHFRNMPSIIEEVVADRYDVSLEVSGTTLRITASPLFDLFQLKLPDIDVLDLAISLGTVAVSVWEFELVIEKGSNVELGALIKLGLPSDLNNVFGTENGEPRVRLFRTFDPDNPEDSTVDFRLSAGTKGMTLYILTMPFNYIETETEDGKAYWNIDLGEFGAGRVQIPELGFDLRHLGFRAAGAIEVVRQPQIPLGFVKNLFHDIGQDDVANWLPDALSITPINLVDEEGHLKVEEIKDFFDNRLPKPLVDVLEFVSDQLDKTPDRFRSYLHMEPIKSVNFDFEVTVAGRIRFWLTCEPGIRRLMQPGGAPVPMPVINGIELRKIGFDELLAGQIIALELDMTFDAFDVFSLASGIAFSDNDIWDAMLPEPTSLVRTLELRNLYCIIPYQSGVPIPIPVFFDKVGIEYLGIEGMAFGTSLSFPAPDFNLVEGFTIFTDLLQFFQDRDFLLDPGKKVEDMNLSFSIGPSYFGLPKYLGGNEWGQRTHDVLVWNAYENIAYLLNWLKTLRISELVGAIPQQYRVGALGANNAGTLTARLLFLDVEVAWAITTPQEFPSPQSYPKPKEYPAPARLKKGMYELLPASGFSQDDYLRMLPVRSASPETEDGLAVFLAGHLFLGGIAVEGAFALLATDLQGFRTGFRFAGDLAGLLRVDMGGSVLLAGNFERPIIELNGDFSLKIAGAEVLHAQLTASEEQLRVAAGFDLFPHQNLIVARAEAEGVLSSKEIFRLELRDVNLGVGGVYLVRNGRGVIGAREVGFSGSFLSQEVSFLADLDKDDLSLTGGVKLGFSETLTIPGPIQKTGASNALVTIGNGMTLKASIKGELFSTISLHGYHGHVDVTVRVSLGGESFHLPIRFSIDVVPGDLAQLAGHVARAIKAELAKLLSADWSRWLQAVMDGTVDFARHSAAAIARVLKDAFSLGPNAVGQALLDAKFSAEAVASVLKEIFGLGVGEIVKFFNDFTNLGDEAIGKILKAIGFDVDVIKKGFEDLGKTIGDWFT